MRILLVEDEVEMARLIVSLVAHAGFEIEHVASISDAIEAFGRCPYELVLLDRRLPDGDAVSKVSSLRAIQPGVRVIMLTALDALSDKVSGLEAGADDYLTKPFQGEELIARVRACMRRPGGDVLPPIVVGAVSFDLNQQEVKVNGFPVAFNRRELSLLCTLIRRASRVSTRETIIEEVYGRQEDVQANTLDRLVSRLRTRLEALDARIEIHTVRGTGYLLTEQPS